MQKDDVISRRAAIDAAIDAVDDWDGGCSKERERFIREALEELPSAEPELVRCEDCRCGREACGNIECWVDTKLTELSECQNTPYVSALRTGLKAIKILIHELPDGFPIPLEKER